MHRNRKAPIWSGRCFALKIHVHLTATCVIFFLPHCCAHPDNVSIKVRNVYGAIISIVNLATGIRRHGLYRRKWKDSSRVPPITLDWEMFQGLRADRVLRSRSRKRDPCTRGERRRFATGSRQGYWPRRRPTSNWHTGRHQNCASCGEGQPRCCNRRYGRNVRVGKRYGGSARSGHGTEKCGDACAAQRIRRRRAHSPRRLQPPSCSPAPQYRIGRISPRRCIPEACSPSLAAPRQPPPQPNPPVRHDAGSRQKCQIFLCHHKAAMALVVRTGASWDVWQASRWVHDDAWRRFVFPCQYQTY